MEGKWSIELDGRKMNNWDNFYYQIMPQIDFYEYSKKFEISSHTVKDAALEFEIIEKYLRDNNYNGITIVYKYPNMPRTYKGWRLENVQFQQEGKENPQINIQLGQEGGKGLEIFNKNIKEINFRKEIIKNGKK